jgi:DNA-binding CsgD family transcriptional regulator
VDRFDTDGRRFLVAKKNPPELAGDPALTRRERHAVVAMLQCQSQRLAAYALGLSASTLRTHLVRAMRKLGVKSLAGLLEVAGALVGPTEVARAARALPRRRA